jgi:hypothetical protein
MTSPLRTPISGRHVFAAQPPPGHRILAQLQSDLARGSPKNVALEPLNAGMPRLRASLTT